MAAPDAGISDCVDAFIDADGACRPAMAKCAAGEIPDIDVGCMPVGVPVCFSDFIDARGVCMPVASDCPAGTFVVPNEGCVSIDGPEGCGTGTWGNVPDDPGNIYVDGAYQGATQSGSKAEPFTTLAPAVAAAEATGGSVVLAAGSYVAGLSVTGPLHIRGVCASQVTLTATAEDPVLLLAPGAGETIAVSDLTMSGGAVGVAALAGTSELARLYLHDVGFGVSADDADTVLSVEGSLIEDTTGPGAYASAGTLSVVRTAVVRAQRSAVQGYGGDVTAEDVFLADTLPDPDGSGYAAAGQLGAGLTIRRSVLRDNDDGVYSDTALVIEDSVVGATIDNVSDMVSVASGSLDLRRSALVDGQTWGLYVYFDGIESVLLEHVLVADVGAGPNGGAAASFGAPFTMQKSAFVHNTGTAVTTYDNAVIEGLILEDGVYDMVNGAGSGLAVLDDGVSSVTRSYFRGIEDVGVYYVELNDAGGTFSFTDSRIEQQPGVDDEFVGIGVAIDAPMGNASLSRVVIEDVRTAGILNIGSQLSLKDSVIRTVATGETGRLQSGGELVGPVGDGVLFVGGSESHAMSLENVWIEGATRAGVMASTGAHVAKGLRVLGGAIGIALRDGATLAETDTDLSGNEAEREDPSALPVP